MKTTKTKTVWVSLALYALTSYTYAGMLFLNNNSPKEVQVYLGRKGNTEKIKLIPGQQSLVISEKTIRVQSMFYDMGWISYSKNLTSCFGQGDGVNIEKMLVAQDQTANITFLEIGTSSYSKTRDAYCIYSIRDNNSNDEMGEE